MPKKVTKQAQLQKRFGRRIDAWATPILRLDERDARFRQILLMHSAYEMGQSDYKKLVEQRTKRSARGVKLCETCGNPEDSYAHGEICGV